MQTQNLGLAGALALTTGQQPATHNTDGRVTFEFADNSQLTEIRDSYFAGQLSGDLKAFNSILRDLMAAVREVRRG